MNHKLRVLVRVDADPGQVTLEVTGCLTQSNAPALLHIMRRAGRLGAGTDVIINLHGASHVDPEVLLSDYFDGTLDPAVTVRGLPDTTLCELADALYRHLDTSSPSFGAHTWYELATEELQNRHLADANGSAAGELAAGPTQV